MSDASNEKLVLLKSRNVIEREHLLTDRLQSTEAELAAIRQKPIARPTLRR
jgi:uncharacterized protein YydD (DUF2326 family)